MINWLDIAILVILFYSAGMGWKRGLVRQFFDVAAVVASYFAALRYGGEFMAFLTGYIPLEQWFPRWFNTVLPAGIFLGDAVIRLVGFVVLFVLVRIVFKAASKVLHGIFSLPLLGTVNGLGGMALGFAKGAILTLILVAVLSLLSTPFWARILEDSVIATSVQYWWPLVYKQMVDILMKDLLL